MRTKILASFPLYSHPDIAGKALESLVEVDTYIVCNTPSLKWLLAGEYVVNKTNNYCNGAWNQAMAYFLKHKKYDWLVLSSQDVIMKKGWSKLLQPKDKEVYVPGYAGEYHKLNDANPAQMELVGGVAGACTFLPREAVELVYPIPKELRLWFGDQWMFTRLRKHGWRVMQGTMAAYHYGSLSIFENPSAYQVIEADKIAWEEAKKLL